MAAKASLDDYPALARWYAAQRTMPVPGSPEQLVVGTCAALRAGGAVDAWVAAFRAFLRASARPLADFLAAEATMQACDAELLDLVGDFGESAVRGGDSDGFFDAMRLGAEATGLVVFRFLSAWTALNAGRPDVCVEECELVTEPFASVHTLHGQALLELGRPVEALETLDVAIKLAPQEILAWFQKAKALHVLDRRSEAFAALRECHRMAPQSDEVTLYMGMIAVEGCEAATWTDAYAILAPALTRLGDVAIVTLILIRLAALLSDKPKAVRTLRSSPWSGRLDYGDTSNLAVTLRLLGDRGWMDVAATLLGKVTPQMAS